MTNGMLNIVAGLIVVVALAAVAALMLFGGALMNKAQAALGAEPCSPVVVGGTRCVYCTSAHGVAISCDWRTP